MTERNLVTEIRTADAASRASTDPEVAGYYSAIARVLLSRLMAEVESLRIVVEAREAELVRRAGGDVPELPGVTR